MIKLDNIIQVVYKWRFAITSWKLLIDKNIKKKDLQSLSGVSSATITKLGRNENVNTDSLQKICTALECDIDDVVELIPAAVKTESAVNDGYAKQSGDSGSVRAVGLL